MDPNPNAAVGDDGARGSTGARRTRFALETYGVGVDVDVRHRCSPGRCTEPGLDELVRALLPPGAAARPDVAIAAARFSITCEGNQFTVETASGGDGKSGEEPICSSGSAPRALHALDSAIRTAIALEAPGLVFVHAGVVAVDGRAIVIPGPSMAGKTTLVAALVRAGATYLSDEYAVLDTGGLVHPYPRRLSVRGATGRREVPVTELGGHAATTPLPVVLVASITYRPDAAWSVRSVDGATGAGALIANAVAARTRSTEVLQAVGTVARAATHMAGERGDAAAAAEALTATLATG